MIIRMVKLRAGSDPVRVRRLVEKTCRSLGLDMKIKRPYSHSPKSVHWHYKRGSEPGTIEVTFWEEKERLWLSVHSNRTGSWTSGGLVLLERALQEELDSK